MLAAQRQLLVRPDSPESQYSQDPFSDGHAHVGDAKDFTPYALPAQDEPSSSTSGANWSTLPRSSTILTGYSPSGGLADLLDPPPAAFLRQPPSSLAYGPFTATSVYGWSNQLEKGFPTLPPPSESQPHPFTTHDVTEKDWALFLGQLRAVAEAHPVNSVVAAVMPAAKGIRMPLGKLSPVTFIARQGVKAHARSRRNGPVGELIDTWNRYFFYPRGVEIVLAQGKYVFSGTGDVRPPDMVKATRSSATESKWRLVVSARQRSAGRTR